MCKLISSTKTPKRKSNEYRNSRSLKGRTAILRLVLYKPRPNVSILLDLLDLLNMAGVEEVSLSSFLDFPPEVTAGVVITSGFTGLWKRKCV